MTVTESQHFLARDLLQLRKKLSGEKFDEDDVQKLAQGIARHAWVDQQLNQMLRAKTGIQNYN